MWLNGRIKIAVCAVCSAVVVAVSTPVSAYEPLTDISGNKAIFSEEAQKTFCIVNGKKAVGSVTFFDKDNEPHYYYFLKDGSMFKGFLRRKDGHIYYYKEDKSDRYCGELFTGGEIVINGNEYLFDECHGDTDCYKLDGWIAERYYLKNSGRLKNRRVKIDGRVYCFDDNGLSVPATIADAEPGEFSFIRLGENADDEALRCGMGKAKTVKTYAGPYYSRYTGTVLVDGKECEVFLNFDRNKSITAVSLKVKGDRFDYFYNILNDIYGQNRIHETGAVRYAEYTVLDDDADLDGEIGGERSVIKYEYDTDTTHMFCGYIYVEEIE